MCINRMNGESIRMEEYIITDELVAKVKKQFNLWAMFLNNGIGLLSFTFGLASLGTPIPWVRALMSLIIVLYIRCQGEHYFPSEITKLQEIAKEDKNARILLKGLKAELFSTKKLFTEYLVCLIGILFLTSIALSPFVLGFNGTFSLYFSN